MNKSFKSNEEYTLMEIFSPNNKIIIPDLQRDYCWGGNKEKLVPKFIENIIEIFSKRKDEGITLGLLYGYEEPKNHIQLCDGQQRITTLFLLLGMLNRKTGYLFKNYLMSEEGDKEPRLQYAIRESTLYFMSDLVHDFFCKDGIFDIDEIKKQNWYFEEYNLDASIKSIIYALKEIYNILEEKKILYQDYENFGNFILRNLKMIYYDMINRKQGEKTFVIINTTGEPLTVTENLKPILIGNINDEEMRKLYSNIWEYREKWFWERKGEKNKTADNGIKEFFLWIRLLELNNDEWKSKDNYSWNDWINTLRLPKQDTPETLETLKILDKYFNVVKFLFEKDLLEKNFIAPPKDGNTQIALFELLPLIKYVEKFGLNIEEEEIIRVKHFFKNLAKIENVSRAANELLPKAIEIINKLPSSDIASILDVEDAVSKQILTDEEKEKFKLYRDSHNREDLERKFWNAEKHDIWNAEIHPLIKWAETRGQFSVSEFDKYNATFNELFCDTGDEIKKQPCDKLDLIRRALLITELKDYPRIFKGAKHSFCFKSSDWKKLISDKDNIDTFKKFLDIIILNKNNINYMDAIDEMIEKYKKENKRKVYPYHDFISNKDLLGFCHEKKVQYDGYDWILFQKGSKNSKYIYLKTYLLFLDLEKEKKEEDYIFNEWNINIHNYNTGILLEKKSTLINVGYYAKEFRLQLESSDANIVNIAKSYLSLNREEKYESAGMNENEILSLLKKILIAINKLP